MGGAPSSTAALPSKCRERPAATEEEMIMLLMPLYHTTEPITAEEKAAAKKVWNMIIGNQCQHFSNFKQTHLDCTCSQATQFLNACFFERLFTVHPACRGLFVRDVSKMSFAPMISSFVAKLDQPEGLERVLTNLINSHNKMGVKAVECKPICCC